MRRTQHRGPVGIPSALFRRAKKGRGIPLTSISNGRNLNTSVIDALTAEQIRTATAEYMYLVVQSKDLGRETAEAEEVLLETEWQVLFT